MYHPRRPRCLTGVTAVQATLHKSYYPIHNFHLNWQKSAKTGTLTLQCMQIGKTVPCTTGAHKFDLVRDRFNVCSCFAACIN